LGYRIDRTRRPLAVAMTAEVERVNVIVVAQRARHPVPTARVIQPAVHEHHWRFVVAPVIPVMELQAVRVKKERTRFEWRVCHCRLCLHLRWPRGSAPRNSRIALCAAPVWSVE